MTKLSRILCAVDFSEPAHAAFSQALAVSRAHDAELQLHDDPGLDALPTVQSVTRLAATPAHVTFDTPSAGRGRRQVDQRPHQPLAEVAGIVRRRTEAR